MQNIALIYDNKNDATIKVAHLLGNALRTHSCKVSMCHSENVSGTFFSNVDMIVFGSASSFGNVSSNFMRFMESTNSFWYEQPWRNKFAAGFTVTQCNTIYKLSTLHTIQDFAAYHGMHWVSLGVLPRFICGQQSDGQNRLSCYAGLAMEYVNNGATIEFHAGDLLTLELFAKRISEIKIKSNL